MIVSASRRTDIPAFYSEWVMNRLRAGYCTVPNPFNRNQVSRISLLPSDVEAVVFWTRNPRPLMAHLDEIDSLGLRYYFQFTILGYPREIDPKAPPLHSALETLRELSEHVGPGRVVWRYDPIVFSKRTPPEYHRERFESIAGTLAGHTNRVVISVVDHYRKIEKRLRALEQIGAGFTECDTEQFARLMRDFVSVAHANSMDIVSCAEELELEQYGIRPGKCVDDEFIKGTFGIEVSGQKDPSQRKACGCVTSRDIGMYDSCVYGCQYCYATGSFERAAKNRNEHDPQSPSLIGWYE